MLKDISRQSTIIYFLYISQKVKFLRSQPNIFRVAFKRNNNLSVVGFFVSHCIEENDKPLSDGEYLKKSFF